jgi:hypothetical protein
MTQITQKKCRQLLEAAFPLQSAMKLNKPDSFLLSGVWGGIHRQQGNIKKLIFYFQNKENRPIKLLSNTT